MSAGEKERAEVRRVAPPGKFVIIGVDTLDGSEWPEGGDFDTLDMACKHAKSRTDGKKMLLMYIFDDMGKCLERYGTF